MVWGTFVVECVGEETNEKDVDGNTFKTPPTNSVIGEVRDTFGRFSACQKIQKQQQQEKTVQ